MIGIIKRKASIKELAEAYHAECLAYCQELLELQKKWDEVCARGDMLRTVKVVVGILEMLLERPECCRSDVVAVSRAALVSSFIRNGEHLALVCSQICLALLINPYIDLKPREDSRKDTARPPKHTKKSR